MIPKIRKIEIRVGNGRVTVSDKLRLKAIQMKAKAEELTLAQFRRVLSEETREFYRRKLYPTKLGPEKAYRDEGGDWRAPDLDHGSQPYTLQSVLEANLYRHIRAYLMGLVLSQEGKRDKGSEAGAVILRNDNKVAIVKRGKLELHSSDDWLGTLAKKKRSQKDERFEEKIRGRLEAWKENEHRADKALGELAQGAKRAKKSLERI